MHIGQEVNPEELDTSQYKWINTNRALCEYPGTIAGKTGGTALAKQNLTIVTERGGERLISVILNAGDSPTSPNQVRYPETYLLQNYGYRGLGIVNATSTSFCNEEAAAIEYDQSNGHWEASGYFGSQDFGQPDLYIDGFTRMGGPGSSATMTFEGEGIEWYAFQSESRGKAEVYIDDVLIETVDLYSPESITKQVVFSKLDLKEGQHTIEILPLEEKNPAAATSTSPTWLRVDVDGLRVTGGIDNTSASTSNISSGTSTEISTTVTWTTDEQASSQVEYGTTTSYGTLTTLDESLVTSHSVSLSDLAPGTTYHYRVRSVDVGDNETLSADQTLTTGEPLAPSVTAFDIASTSNDLSVAINTFTATDDTGVAGYMVTESSTTPSASDPAWTASAPSSYSVTSEGSGTLYAWAKDAAGNVSSSTSDTVAITLPDTGWQHHLKITIPAGNISSTLSNFPVYVDLENASSTNFFQSVQEDGDDIRVTASDGVTEVPREVVSIATSTETGELYFKAPTLSSTSTNTFYIYYGSSTAANYADTDTFGAENVWTNGFSAVYHLEQSIDSTSFTVQDSTGNNSDGSIHNSSSSNTVAAKLGKGWHSDGDDAPSVQYLLTPAVSTAGVSMWINTLNKEDDANNHYLLDGRLDISNSWWNAQNSRDDLLGSYWTSLYVDGVSGPEKWNRFSTGEPKFVYVGAGSAETGNLHILSRYTETLPAKATIDEVRVHSGARTSSWISTTYDNQNNPATFYTITDGQAGDDEEEDVTDPTVTAFIIEATSTDLTVAINSFTATDDTGVTGYLVTESATAPIAGDSGWQATATTSYIFATDGSKTLYGWAKDAAGNISASQSDTTTIDTTAPSDPGTPTTANPTSDTTPTWTWSASSDAGSGLATPAYTVEWSQDGTFNTITGSSTANTASFTHAAVLSAGTWHFRVHATDIFGNSSSRSSGSTLINTTAPTIDSISSDTAAGSYTVGDTIDIDLAFSEAVTSTGNVTVTLETGTTDRTCIFTASSASTATCTYTVQSGDTSTDLNVSTVSGTITDTAGNAMTDFTPTTNLITNEAIIIDTTDPTIQVLSPNDNATDISTTTNLVITFDETVIAQSGNILLKHTSDDTTVEVFAVTSDITGSGSTIITANPANPLSADTGYYVQIDTTAFDDSAGNSYAGITGSTTWNFTTTANANTAPTITSSATANTQENQTTAIDVNATDPDTGDTLTYAITGGTDSADFSISSATGLLSFTSAPDYESPSDADINNTYTVTVEVSDGTAADSQTIIITVTDTSEGSGGGSSSGGGFDSDDEDKEEEDTIATATISGTATATTTTDPNQNTPTTTALTDITTATTTEAVKDLLQDKIETLLDILFKQLVSLLEEQLQALQRNLQIELSKSSQNQPSQQRQQDQSTLFEQQPPLSSCTIITHTLYFGLDDSTTDGEVSELQTFLTQIGDYTFPRITGYFGSVTKNAVIDFQIRTGIISNPNQPSGGVGYNTQAMIEEVSCG